MEVADNLFRQAQELKDLIGVSEVERLEEREINSLVDANVEELEDYFIANEGRMHCKDDFEDAFYDWVSELTYIEIYNILSVVGASDNDNEINESGAMNNSEIEAKNGSSRGNIPNCTWREGGAMNNMEALDDLRDSEIGGMKND